MRKKTPSGQIRLNKGIKESIRAFAYLYGDPTAEREKVSSEFDNLVTQIAHVSKSFMRSADVSEILISYLEGAREKFAGKNLDERIDLTAKLLIDGIESYPRSYQISVPLSHFLPTRRDFYFEFGPTIKIVLDNGDGSAELRCKSRGYWSGGGGRFVGELVRDIKLFAFSLQPYCVAYIPTSGVVDSKITDLTSRQTDSFTFPDRLPGLLRDIKLKDLETVEAKTDRDFEHSFTSAMVVVDKVFTALKKPQNARIATAVEWYIDSLLVTNQTVALLEVCIGLEAILGDEEDMTEMTRRLCDRLAYTLGKSPEERKSLHAKYESPRVL